MSQHSPVEWLPGTLDSWPVVDTVMCSLSPGRGRRSCSQFGT